MKPGEPYSPYRLFLCAFVPLPIMAMTDISPGAKLLFGRLALYAGQNTTCFPKLDRLSADLGSSVDSIGRWMAELTAAKLLNRAQKGSGRPAECEFIWHAALSGVTSAEVQKLDSASAESRNQAFAEMGDQLPQIRGSASAESRMHLKEEAVQLNGSGKRFTHNGARATVADMNGQASQRFEEFWNLYPRKQRRDFACSQWLSVVTTENEAIVFACLANYLASGDVDRGAVMNPDRWLYEQHRNQWRGTWPKPAAQERSRLERTMDAI